MQLIILRTCIYAMAAPNRIDRNGFSGVDRSWRFKTRLAVSQLLSGASFQIAAWFHVQWYRNCAIAAPRHAIHQFLSLAARTLIACSISSACCWRVVVVGREWLVSQVIIAHQLEPQSAVLSSSSRLSILTALSSCGTSSSSSSSSSFFFHQHATNRLLAEVERCVCGGVMTSCHKFFWSVTS